MTGPSLSCISSCLGFVLSSSGDPSQLIDPRTRTRLDRRALPRRSVL